MDDIETEWAEADVGWAADEEAEAELVLEHVLCSDPPFDLYPYSVQYDVDLTACALRKHRCVLRAFVEVEGVSLRGCFGSGLIVRCHHKGASDELRSIRALQAWRWLRARVWAWLVAFYLYRRAHAPA